MVCSDYKIGSLDPVENLGRFLNRLEKICEGFSSALKTMNPNRVFRCHQRGFGLFEFYAKQIKQGFIVWKLAAHQRLHVFPVRAVPNKNFHVCILYLHTHRVSSTHAVNHQISFAAANLAAVWEHVLRRWALLPRRRVEHFLSSAHHRLDLLLQLSVLLL